MTTTFEVRDATGTLLGAFPGRLADHVADIRALIAEHPGADLRPVVTVDDPCPDHPPYERTYCPPCGTAREI